MYKRALTVLTETADNFIASDSPTRGAAIAFYSVTSLVPVMIIVIAVGGLAFGEEAARGALMRELATLIGSDGAKLIQDTVQSAAISGSSGFALFLGAVILVFTASGVFAELQSALNAIWKVEPRRFSISRLLKERAASLGLVVGLGFLLLVSLVLDAGISATSDYINRHFQYGAAFLNALTIPISFMLTAALFAAIYKVLPDKSLDWSDVAFGAVVTSFAFEGGKFLIAWYLGSNATISSYGAAGALASVILWIYYSSQVFLLGASFTKACAISLHRRRGHDRARTG